MLDKANNILDQTLIVWKMVSFIVLNCIMHWALFHPTLHRVFSGRFEKKLLTCAFVDFYFSAFFSGAPVFL
jgi:hypothetical protein